MADQDPLKDMALHYHRYPRPGKLQITPTKPMVNQRDLALAYSPGVAYACEAIVEDPQEARNLTSRGNLVAVITNGTAVLGLGAIGPLASKPVMEGKAVLFKKFADIDVFDIEINELDPIKLADIIIALEPTFGAINLEDIKAPECFIVEQRCREKMSIPVFHDDQHGTAIVVSAAMINGLRVVEKNIADVKVVSTGGGAAGIACLNLLIRMGLSRENITLVDVAGVIYKGRTEEMNPHKEAFAQDTTARQLGDVIAGADVFLGLSAGGILKPEMVKKMADKPLILALANPTPEIMPDLVHKIRPDAIIATGRSDFPNQVNNVLCFPFIFKGALDVGATTINEEMKIAAVNAIANLAMAESSEVVAKAYSGEKLLFGPEYLIPKPFDPRLISHIAPAIAKAAMDSGVASKPIEDFEKYHDELERAVLRSGMVMKPIFEHIRGAQKRIVFAEGEDERTLRAARVIIDDEIGKPILIGRPDIIARRIEQFGLHLDPAQDFEICNPESDSRFEQYWRFYHKLSERSGISPDAAQTILRTNSTVIAACMLAQGEADAMICGIQGRYDWHLRYVTSIIGKAAGVRNYYSMSTLILQKGAFFFCDTHVTLNPSAEDLVELTLIAAHEVSRFGIVPRVALLSHSNFGSGSSKTACKVRKAAKILRDNHPELIVDGEMQADNALDEELRRRMFPNSKLEGEANLFIMPNQDAAHIAFSMVKKIADGLVIGPLLIGAAKPAHILTASVTSRGIVNMTAIAIAEAMELDNKGAAG